MEPKGMIIIDDPLKPQPQTIAEQLREFKEWFNTLKRKLVLRTATPLPEQADEPIIKE